MTAEPIKTDKEEEVVTCPKCKQPTSTKEQRKGYWCKVCDEEVDETVKKYECNCGNIFNADEGEGQPENRGRLGLRLEAPEWERQGDENHKGDEKRRN